MMEGPGAMGGMPAPGNNGSANGAQGNDQYQRMGGTSISKTFITYVHSYKSKLIILYS